MNMHPQTLHSILPRKSFAKKLLLAICLLIFTSVAFNVPNVDGQDSESPLEIYDINPDHGLQGVIIETTVLGRGFTQETRIYLRRGTFTVNPTIKEIFLGVDWMHITFDIPSNPDLLGSYNVTVWNPNGDEYTLQNGFSAVVGELNRLTVTGVTPESVVLSYEGTWLDVRGTGFVYMADGRKVNSNWDPNQPFSTLVIPPTGIAVDEIQVLNSTCMRLKIGKFYDIPPQLVTFKVFNPSTTWVYSDTWENLWNHQNDPNQLSGFSITIIREIPELPKASFLILLFSLFLVVAVVFKKKTFLKDHLKPIYLSISLR